MGAFVYSETGFLTIAGIMTHTAIVFDTRVGPRVFGNNHNSSMTEGQGLLDHSTGWWPGNRTVRPPEAALRGLGFITRTKQAEARPT